MEEGRPGDHTSSAHIVYIIHIGEAWDMICIVHKMVQTVLYTSAITAEQEYRSSSEFYQDWMRGRGFR